MPFAFMLLPVMQTEEEKMPRIDDLCTWSQIAQPSPNFVARQGALLQGAIDIVWSEWGVFRRMIVTRPHVLARENVLLSFLQMSAAKLTDLVSICELKPARGCCGFDLSVIYRLCISSYG